MECLWCDRTIRHEDREPGKAILVPELCMECANVKWKKHDLLAIWVEELAIDLGCLCETNISGTSE